MNDEITRRVSLTKFAASNGLSAAACLSLARLFLNGPLKRFGFRTDRITRFDSYQSCIAERVELADFYFAKFRPFCSFAGKTVLELGCNRGFLLESFLRAEPFTAIGADIDEDALSHARQALGDRARFIRSTATSIPLPDASVDLVYTIDTVEHLSQPREIFLDVHRVMRGGGILFAYFCPWLSPYGSHMEDVIPFPWANVVFSMDTLLTVAAAIYDSPDYKTAGYYIDQQTGRPRPNPYLDRAAWEESLNRITIRRFRKLVESSPFELVHFETMAFGGRTFKFARLLRPLARLPGLNEMFNTGVFCVLKKTAAPKQ